MEKYKLRYNTRNLAVCGNGEEWEGEVVEKEARCRPNFPSHCRGSVTGDFTSTPPRRAAQAGTIHRVVGS